MTRQRIGLQHLRTLVPRLIRTVRRTRGTKARRAEDQSTSSRMARL